VLPCESRTAVQGYRRLGAQALRIDLAEKLLREAHALRMAAGRRAFVLDPALATSMGLATASYAALLRLAGFKPIMPRPLRTGAFGPPAPVIWRWHPQRPHQRSERAESPALRPPAQGAFAALAELVR